MSTGSVEQVVKGHGTGNDFLVLPDLAGRVRLSPDLVRALCDRHTGIGADGVLRVVRSSEDPESAPMAADAPWFMDYRNADGSLAEMCGNGIRVFVRYLQRAGLADSEVAVATRSGIRRTWARDAGIEVDMGRPQLLPDPVGVRVAGLHQVTGTAVRMPNPHVVVPVRNRDALERLDLRGSPTLDPSLAEGQNVEFAVRTGARALRMRVHERGVGETLSCGTGICAVVVATAAADGAPTGDDTVWQVDPPGGRCLVSWRLDGSIRLTGPAVLVADIRLDRAWLSAAGG